RLHALGSLRPARARLCRREARSAVRIPHVDRRPAQAYPQHGNAGGGDPPAPAARGGGALPSVGSCARGSPPGRGRGACQPGRSQPGVRFRGDISGTAVWPQSNDEWRRPMRGLRDKVALVTGAASGIGRAVALRLGDEGCRVAAVDLNLDGARATAAEIGESACALQADVSYLSAVREAVAPTGTTLGPLDRPVGCAGRGPGQTFDDDSAQT